MVNEIRNPRDLKKINQEKLINYSKSAAKGAVIGGATGAIVVGGFAINQLLDNIKISKLTKKISSR